jgi:hypothetical protein
MATPHDEPLRLSARACTSLARGLDALGPHTEAPLRVRGHAVGRGHDVFDVQEEFELGPRGRRFLLSVDVLARETLLLGMGGAPGDIT